MTRAPHGPTARQVWTPPRRTRRHVRTSRVKVAGSLALVILLLLAVLVVVA